jgi:hypothetical protein
MGQPFLHRHRRAAPMTGKIVSILLEQG